MFMNATVGAVGGKVQFWAGTDFSYAGGNITNSRQKVTFTSMNGVSGALTTIMDPVNINNTDTNPHTIDLELGTWTGTSSTPLYNISITMYSGGTQEGNSIVLTPSGAGEVTTTGQVSITGGAVWSVEWNIYWEGTATASNSVTVDLQLIVSS
jgi:hypothetical protein